MMIAQINCYRTITIEKDLNSGVVFLSMFDLPI